MELIARTVLQKETVYPSNLKISVPSVKKNKRVFDDNECD